MYIGDFVITKTMIINELNHLISKTPLVNRYNDIFLQSIPN